MRLGEVLREEETPPPPPKRRGRWLLPVVAPLAVAGAAWVHGPGVAQLDRGDVLVVTGWPHEAPRVIEEPGIAFWLPLLQTAQRVSLDRHQVTTEVEGRLVEGGRVTGGPLDVRWTPRADDVPALLAQWGPAPADWDAAVAGLAAAAFIEVIASVPADALPARADGLRTVAAKAVGDTLAARGVRVDDVQIPPLRLAGQTAEALEAITAAQRRAAEAQRRGDEARRTSAARREAVMQGWRVRRAELTAELAESAARADALAAAERAEADLYAARAGGADAWRRETQKMAAGRAELGRLRAQAAALRAAGLAEHGERLVEQAIARVILPAAARVAWESRVDAELNHVWRGEPVDAVGELSEMFGDPKPTAEPEPEPTGGDTEAGKP